MIFVNTLVGDFLEGNSVTIDSHRTARTQVHKDGYIIALHTKMSYSQPSIAMSEEAFEALYVAMTDARKRRKRINLAKRIRTYLWTTIVTDDAMQGEVS